MAEEYRKNPGLSTRGVVSNKIDMVQPLRGSTPRRLMKPRCLYTRIERCKTIPNAVGMRRHMVERASTPLDRIEVYRARRLQRRLHGDS